jgi:hypothetical protein
MYPWLLLFDAPFIFSLLKLIQYYVVYVYFVFVCV